MDGERDGVSRTQPLWWLSVTQRPPPASDLLSERRSSQDVMGGGGTKIRSKVSSCKMLEYRKKMKQEKNTHSHTQTNNKQLPVCVESHDHHEETHNCVTCKCLFFHMRVSTCQAPPPLHVNPPPSSETPPSSEAHTRRVAEQQNTASPLVRLRSCNPTLHELLKSGI